MTNGPAAHRAAPWLGVSMWGSGGGGGAGAPMGVGAQGLPWWWGWFCVNTQNPTGRVVSYGLSVVQGIAEAITYVAQGTDAQLPERQWSVVSTLGGRYVG